MWKFVKLVLGLTLMLLSIVGAISVFSGSLEKVARNIVENGVDTTGEIVSRSVHYVGVRVAKVGGGGRYYTMKYAFTTKEGRKYGGSINVSQDQAYAAKDGQQIRVRYHAKQPSINAPLGFKEYMTEADIKTPPKGTVYFTTLLMLLGGAWLTWSSVRRIWPAAGPSRPNAVAVASAPASRLPRAGAVAGAGGKAAFGRR